MMFWDLRVRGFLAGGDTFPGPGMFGAGDRGPDVLGPGCKDKSPFLPPPPAVCATYGPGMAHRGWSFGQSHLPSQVGLHSTQLLFLQHEL